MSQPMTLQEPEHLKPEPMDEVIPVPMELTELNNDCLEHIFQFLNVDDLLTIAHTNKQLKPAADLAFARKFYRKKVTTFCFGHRHWYGVKNPFEINDLKTALRLLRCFGHLISIITVHSSIRRTSIVVSHVNRYCHKTLVEVSFETFGHGFFGTLNNPFENAETVRFNHCNLFGNLENLNKWFPKMRNLRLYVARTEYNCTAVRFPQLQELKIKVLYYMSNKEWSYIEPIIHKNPQLRRLICHTSKTKRLLQIASKKLRSLEHLDISCNRQDFVGDKVFDFPNLQSLKIYCKNDMITTVPILPNCLTEFSWRPDHGDLDLNDALINFLMKYPSIQKVNLISGCDYGVHKPIPNEEKLMKMAEILPLLEEIDFGEFQLSADTATRFIGNCISLKRVCFKMIEQSELDRLKASLGTYV